MVGLKNEAMISTVSQRCHKKRPAAWHELRANYLIKAWSASAERSAWKQSSKFCLSEPFCECKGQICLECQNQKICCVIREEQMGRASLLNTSARGLTDRLATAASQVHSLSAIRLWILTYPTRWSVLLEAASSFANLIMINLVAAFHY